MIDMNDVQNYYLSFFAGFQAPEATTAEGIEEEVKEDKEQI